MVRKVERNRMIYIFGANVCKFCKKQVKYLKNTFGEYSDEWEYIDVSGDSDAVKIAQGINIENIPAIVILGKKNELMLNKEGTLPADQIYKIINKNNKKIPFSHDEEKKILKRENIIKVLSYDPYLVEGDIVQANTYENKFICSMKVKSCIKYDVTSRNFTQEQLNLYNKCGGRKDIAWKLNLIKQK